MRRGSATTSRAPFRTARLMRSAMTGWLSVVLVPSAKRKGASSNSAMELVIAPFVSVAASPATVGACQVRWQLSTLLVRITARANFCSK